MELFSYLLKASACSALFFAFYLLVLRKLTFFKINRFYMLFSVLLSFVIPALQFTIERDVAASVPIENPLTGQDVDLGGTALETPIIVGTGPVKYEQVPFDWCALLPYLYGGVVAALLLLTAWRIYQLLKHTKSPVKEINGLKLVAKQGGFTNCSFFNYVFIDENSLTQSELAVLLAHEEVHVKQYHSIDKLILMIAKAFLWFNPVIYLYDKALEQAHEYEADEATSQNIGKDIYATLLLKLAVGKSSHPLIHNFVKSPIKQRIKMLFNSKSKNMKKLAYLLALPIGLGLIWGFTVKIRNRVKPIAQQETHQLQDTLLGKTVKGKVIGFERLKVGGEILNLQVGSRVLPISCYNFKDKVKTGDEISISIGGKSFSPPPAIGTETAQWNKKYDDHKSSYLVSKVLGANGKIIYELPHYAFLYEANRARYAWSTIKSISKDINGMIQKIVLNDKEFTINLNVAAQKFKSDDFKRGDSIVVKFIGEKLTGTKTYATDKMIALYSWPKKYELINQTLYPRFYDEKGRQKVYNDKGQLRMNRNSKAISPPVNTYQMPKLMSSSSATANNRTQITYVKDATIEENGVVLFAKEMIIDSKNYSIIASKATITKGGEMIVSDEIRMNIKTNRFTTKESTGSFDFATLKKIVSAPTKPNLHGIKYSAQDSTKTDKLNKMVYLYGNATIENEKFKVKGSTITYNAKTNTAEVKDASIYYDKNTFTAATMQVNFNTLHVKATGELKASWKD